MKDKETKQAREKDGKQGKEKKIYVELCKVPGCPKYDMNSMQTCNSVKFYCSPTAAFPAILAGSVPGADPGILVRGGVKVAGRGPDQPIRETYILKLFFLQIRLLLDTLNPEF